MNKLEKQTNAPRQAIGYVAISKEVINHKVITTIVKPIRGYYTYKGCLKWCKQAKKKGFFYKPCLEYDSHEFET